MELWESTVRFAVLNKAFSSGRRAKTRKRVVQMAKRMVAVVFGTNRRNKPTLAANRMPCQMPERSDLAAICDRFSIDSTVVRSMGVRALLRDHPMHGRWRL